MLLTSANTLYTGQTNNLERRLKEHQEKKGRGAKYTRSFSSVKLVYKEEFATRKEAGAREKYFKSGAGRRFLKEKLKNKE